MLQAWRAEGIITYAGYIVGFPSDTPETIRRDIAIIQRELPVDLLAFTILTPLPGSEDHKILHERGVWMDPDMNIYDLEHVTTGHPLMSAAEWDGIYREAWNLYFTEAHAETLMRRAVADGIKPVNIMRHILQIHCAMAYERVHPQQCGYFRRKVRRERRPGLARENPLTFYPKRVWQTFATYLPIALYAWRLNRLRKRIQRDPTAKDYTDLALTPVEGSGEDEALAMFELNDAARSAVALAKARTKARADHARRKSSVAAAE